MNPNETPTWRPPPPQVSERRTYPPAPPRRRQPFALAEIVLVSANDNRRDP